MGINERCEIYDKIEKLRDRPLIVYVTSKRDGIDASMASDVLPYLIDQLDALPRGTEEIDFLIVSLGGDPMVAWRIMSLIRQRVKKVSVLVPQTAYSAATLVALGADEIVMHPNSHLGPVDMQMTIWNDGHRRHFSTEDISAFLDFVKDRLGITDQKHLRSLFEMTCNEVGSIGVGFTARSSKLAIALGERMLSMHTDEDDKSEKRESLVETLSRQFHSHSYPVSRDEAIKIGLDVNKERNPDLEELMWRAWLDLEDELQERVRFSEITELLNSAEASKLLSPVPILEVPINATNPPYFNETLADLQAASAIKVNPVDYSYIGAVLESKRLGFSSVTRGKILATRDVHLDIPFNSLVTFNGWETTKKGEGK